jgi:hypothetical protein
MARTPRLPRALAPIVLLAFAARLAQVKRMEPIRQ